MIQAYPLSASRSLAHCPLARTPTFIARTQESTKPRCDAAITAVQAAANIALFGARATRDPRDASEFGALVPRYEKFESISLPVESQVRTCLSREFAFLRREAAVSRGCAGWGERRGRQRRARSSDIALRSGSVSVRRYSSTALSPMRFATVGAPSPSVVGPLGLQQYR